MGGLSDRLHCCFHRRVSSLLSPPILHILSLLTSCLVSASLPSTDLLLLLRPETTILVITLSVTRLLSLVLPLWLPSSALVLAHLHFCLLSRKCASPETTIRLSIFVWVS